MKTIRKQILAFLCLVFLITGHLWAQQDSILIDLGSNASSAPWNNLSDGSGGGAISALQNSRLLTTPIGMTVSDPFNGINTGGTGEPETALEFPGTVTSDSYFGNVSSFSGKIEPTGAFEFYGLNPSLTYNFEIFASRMGVSDVREAKYRLVGTSKDSANLDASNNISSKATISMQPKADGTILLEVSPGPNNTNGTGFYYIGGIKMIYEDPTAILPTAINLQSPNGGEIIEAGTAQLISWEGVNYIGGTTISYSTDNGTTWTSIANIDNPSSSYWWTVPDDQSASCLIKVEANGMSDISDDVFTIAPPPTIVYDTILIDFGTNLSPAPWNNLNDGSGAGNIMNLANSKHQVTPMSVDVYDSFNGVNTGGTSSPDPLLQIPSSASSDSYFGNVTEFSGKIEPTGAMEFAGLNPELTYTFEIFSSRTGTSDIREAKYRLLGASKDSVNLDASNNTSNSVSIDMQPDVEGTILFEVSPGPNNTNSSGFYYLGAIKLIYSDETALLPPSLALISPNGGEEWEAGSSQLVSWEGINLRGETELSFSPDNGSSWTLIETFDSLAHSFWWTIPDEVSDNCLISVASTDLSDYSDATFAILPSSNIEYDTISVDFGASANITGGTWNNLMDVSGEGSIEYLRNSRNLLTGMGLDIYDRFTGSNTNGTTTPEGSLRIPESASADSYYGNVAEWASTIQPTGGMEITGLNSEKTYSFELFASRMGVNDNRETKYIFTGSAKDSIYLDPANNESNIVEITVQPDENGKIILDVSPGENNTNSYGFYYLGSLKMIYEKEEALAPAITLEVPNGGEEWIGNETHTLSWTSFNLIEDIIIQYSTDGGNNWTTIAQLDSSITSYDWNIPSESSSECIIQVSSGTAIDQSDNPFTLISPDEKYLILLSPVGDEYFITEDIRTIKWKAANLTEDILVEYSSDNGSTWVNLATVDAEEQSYLWKVNGEASDQCLIRLSSGVISDVSDASFHLVEGVCNSTICILGSSTAYGSGANPISDSSWVNRYAHALEDQSVHFEVLNFAVGGYNTFKILPDNYTIPETYSESIDESKNVTEALSHSPYAIIINMPSNDAVKYYDVETQMENLRVVANTANAEGVRVWVATTQPRNFADTVQINIQKDVRDAILEYFGDYAIDFWTGIADENGFIISDYDSGDGIHLNNSGHRLLHNRVVGKMIDTLACLPPDGIGEQMLNNEEVRIYPNPCNEEMNIMLNVNSDAMLDVILYDISGRKIGEETRTISGNGSQKVTIGLDKYTINSRMLIALIQIEDTQGLRQHAFKVIKEE